MILRNDNDRIGDFIGTIPAMIELSRQHGGLEVICHESMIGLLNLIPGKYSIKASGATLFDKSFDLMGAFAYAAQNNLHMIQANYHTLGLPVPHEVVRPELEVRNIAHGSFDFILAPFSRSLPEEQLWQLEKWQQLVNSLPDYNFCLLGDPRHDDPTFIKGSNVFPCFGHKLEYVGSLLKSSEKGLISVVTGISHLAYALNVKNYLFFNQGLWGVNVEAHCFTKYIPDITVDEVINKLGV